MSNALHADNQPPSPTAAELRFARRSARYLADQNLEPPEIRHALVQELDLPAQTAGLIVNQLFPEQDIEVALPRAA